MPVNVNIRVSQQNIERLMALMRTMNIDAQVESQVLSEPSISSDEGDMNMYDDDMEEDDQTEYVDCEVRKVVGHRIRNGVFQFRVIWKNNTKSGNNGTWVNDNDCNCEELISEYLEKNKIHTAFLFCRVSTKEQAGSEHFSLQAQEAEMRSMINTGKYLRIKVFTISQSAYRSLPPVLRTIARVANSGDIVVVWRVDRLSRNIEHTMEIINTLNAKNVDLYSHNEKLMYKENRIAFLQAILDAQKEAFALGQRIKSAFRQKRERGDHIGSIPYGMEHEKALDVNGKITNVYLVKNDEESEIIARIIAMRTSKPSEIAEILNGEGKLKRNKVWKASMVSRILKQYGVRSRGSRF